MADNLIQVLEGFSDPAADYADSNAGLLWGLGQPAPRPGAAPVVVAVVLIGAAVVIGVRRRRPAAAPRRRRR